MAPTLYTVRAAVAPVLLKERRRKQAGGPPASPPAEGGGGGGGGGGDGDGGDFGAAMPADNAGSLALLLALIGIATLFTVLIAVWLFLRRPAPDWRASAGGGALDALWLSSACLFLSSAAVECAARRARMGFDARRIVRRWLSASVLLGAAFVAAQIHLWTVLWHGGLVPSTSGYAAVFFAVTGLHGLHVLGGLAFLSHLTLRHSRAAVRAVRASSVRLGAVYWHFMGALWLVLFTLLYFVR